MRIVTAVDLCCGAADLGVRLDLLAIDYWPVAIETHEANHPGVRHLCAAVERVGPREAILGGRLDLLVASAACDAPHFSTAQGDWAIAGRVTHRHRPLVNSAVS